jgi:hypothetical protein
MFALQAASVLFLPHIKLANHLLVQTTIRNYLATGKKSVLFRNSKETFFRNQIRKSRMFGLVRTFTTGTIQI